MKQLGVAVATLALLVSVAATTAQGASISTRTAGTTDVARPSYPIVPWSNHPEGEYVDLQKAHHYWEAERLSYRGLLFDRNWIRFYRSWFWPPNLRVGYVDITDPARKGVTRHLYTRYSLGSEVHCKVVVHLTGRVLGLPAGEASGFRIMERRITTWGYYQYVRECDKDRDGQTG